MDYRDARGRQREVPRRIELRQEVEGKVVRRRGRGRHDGGSLDGAVYGGGGEHRSFATIANGVCDESDSAPGDELERGEQRTGDDGRGEDHRAHERALRREGPGDVALEGEGGEGGGYLAGSTREEGGGFAEGAERSSAGEAKKASLVQR